MKKVMEFNVLLGHFFLCTFNLTYNFLEGWYHPSSLSYFVVKCLVTKFYNLIRVTRMFMT